MFMYMLILLKLFYLKLFFVDGIEKVNDRNKFSLLDMI